MVPALCNVEMEGPLQGNPNVRWIDQIDPNLASFYSVLSLLSRRTTKKILWPLHGLKP